MKIPQYNDINNINARVEKKQLIELTTRTENGTYLLYVLARVCACVRVCMCCTRGKNHYVYMFIIFIYKYIFFPWNIAPGGVRFLFYVFVRAFDVP